MGDVGTLTRALNQHRQTDSFVDSCNGAHVQLKLELTAVVLECILTQVCTEYELRPFIAQGDVVWTRDLSPIRFVIEAGEHSHHIRRLREAVD